MKKNNHFSIDIIKLNHCLNAAKFTIGHLSKERKKLAEKIKKKRNFFATSSEIDFLNKKLNISLYDIKLRDSDYTQDYYKYQSMHRYPDQLSYPVGQTKFEPGENTFMLYDSDKIGRLNFISWDYLYDSDGTYTNDSDKAHLFTGINYTKLRDTDSDQIKQNITKRDFEYHLDYQKDFILATKNEKLFTFSVGDTLFYDDEAFEQKWHKIHLNRIQNTGWEIQGWASAIQNADGKKYRQLYSALNMIPQYAKEKSPVSNSFWVQPNNIVWTNTYLDPLNTSQLNLLAKEDSDYRDASRYYKSRRS